MTTTNHCSALHYPFTIEQVTALRAGDRVELNGRLWTGRDRLHQYLYAGGACPVDLHDGALYHCGPVVIRRRQGWQVCAAGPTTSSRQEPFAAHVIGHCGVRVLIGKGGMGPATLAACRRFGCVYLHAIGGAAAQLGATVRQVNGVYFFEDFGSAEAMWEFEVEQFSAVVTMDAHGNSLHEQIQSASEANLAALVEGGK